MWQARAPPSSRVADVVVGARRPARLVVRAADASVQSAEQTERVASLAATDAGARDGGADVSTVGVVPGDFAFVPDSTWNIFTQ
jgi:hypothetical protein